MEWLPVLITAVALYAAVALIIRQKGYFSEHIMFYGPIMAVKTMSVGFFDRFRKYSTFLRAYATFGVLMVIVISVVMTILLVLSLSYTFAVRPEPTGIYAPQNILLIPGLNEYVPSTIAVWLAFVVTIAIHEFGHGILSRVENIRVRSMGALLFVLPIGFFVEPDEEELSQARGMKKIRMFGAGITNNIVVGGLCFVALILLMGLAAPAAGPVIGGVYQNYSAEQAGVPAYSLIHAVNGTSVSTPADVAAILNSTRPGDTVTLTIGHQGVISDYQLTLSEWPEELANRTTGFMGVTYYDPALVLDTIKGSISPIGFLRLLTVPFDIGGFGNPLRILALDTAAQEFYSVPWAGFFGIIHFLFWCGWINISVGLFNAIPMVPLDGGYILKEGVDRLFERRGIGRYSLYVVTFISTLMIVILFSLIMLPYLFSLTAV
ncbi:MAG TPA: site-2 protease family protein [Methanoregulaceae archaeon]|nr:site-2 protease family protein [Methanoregulaceae archaeon]